MKHFLSKLWLLLSVALSSSLAFGIGGGVIGSGSSSGGAKDPAREPRRSGWVFVQDRATGEPVVLTDDANAMLDSVDVYRLCEENGDCVVRKTTFKLDGQPLALAPGFYVAEFGPSRTDVFEVKAGVPLVLGMSRLERPKVFKDEDPLRVSPDLSKAEKATRSQILARTGRSPDVDAADGLYDLTVVCGPSQMSIFLFPGTYMLSNANQIYTSSSDWLRHVVVP